MRALLNRIYFISGVLSGVCIVAICCIILARVIGRWLGSEVPSSDDFAGFLLAASCFLGLAYTFRQGGHIRVSLFTSRLSAYMQRKVEISVLIIACILVSYLSLQLISLVYESYIFEEVTSGYVPVALWVVQLPLAIGMLLFSIAVFDQTVCLLLWGKGLPKSEEEQLIESSHIDQPDVKQLSAEVGYE